MPGICQSGDKGGLGDGFAHLAYSWHIGSAPPKMAKSRAGPKPREAHLKGQKQAYSRHMPKRAPKMRQIGSNWHLCGIYVAFSGNLCGIGIFQAFLSYLALLGTFWPFLA